MKRDGHTFAVTLRDVEPAGTQVGPLLAENDSVTNVGKHPAGSEIALRRLLVTIDGVEPGELASVPDALVRMAIVLRRALRDAHVTVSTAAVEHVPTSHDSAEFCCAYAALGGSCTCARVEQAA